MLYVRGNPLDYNTWAQFGNRGWSYDAVLPYFRKSEHFEPGGDETRGRGGLLNVANMIERAELLDAFIDAAAAEGCPRNTRLQQRQAGGLRLLPGDAEERPALVHRARLPRSRARPAQSARRDRGLYHAHPAGGQARRRRRLSASTARRVEARCNARGDPGGRSGEVTASCWSCPASASRSCCNRSASR